MLSYSAEVKSYKDRVSTSPLHTNLLTHLKIYRSVEYTNLLAQVEEKHLVLLCRIVDLLIKVMNPDFRNNFENQISMRNLSPQNYGYMKFFVSRIIAILHNPDVPFPNSEYLQTVYSSEFSMFRRYIKHEHVEEENFQEVFEPFFKFFIVKEQ